MKNDLFTANGSELKSPEIKEVDADHSEDSDLLDMIGRDSISELSQEPPKSVKRQIESSSPFLLESLYFQSFGERPRLTREEETALAKRIDQGSSTIRAVLRDAHRLLSRVKRSDAILEAQHTLQTVRRLSGLSATALDKVEHSLLGLMKSFDGSKLPATVVKTLKTYLATVREARQVLEKAKDELVRCNLRLVVDVAKHYTRRGLTLLDLVQEGNIGLMKAAERYQYRKGFKFSTYATWWIRQGITRALADQSRTIRIPVHQTEASHRILRVTRRLERLHETVQAFQEPVALEHPVGDGGTEFGELLPDLQAVPPDAHVHRTEMTQQLDRILENLTPREQTVIRLRFGIGYDQPSTLEQVGQNLSVTRERIRQIEAKALKKLKTPAIKEMFAAIQ
jgi:RNA polymerase primary sigma factor